MTTVIGGDIHRSRAMVTINVAADPAPNNAPITTKPRRCSHGRAARLGNASSVSPDGYLPALGTSPTIVVFELAIEVRAERLRVEQRLIQPSEAPSAHG